MGYLRAKDTVNGALGTCFAIIDGKRKIAFLRKI